MTVPIEGKNFLAGILCFSETSDHDFVTDGDQMNQGLY